MTTPVIERPLADLWWLPLLRGLGKLLLGLLLVTAPGMTLALLIQFVGIFWLIDGLFVIVGLAVGFSKRHWVWSLLRGLLGIVAGLLVLHHPLASAVLIPTLLVLILGVEGVIIGVLDFFEALRGAGWWMAVWGVLYLLIGILFLMSPLFSIQVLVLIIGIAAVVSGSLLIVSAFQLRKG